MSLTKDIRVMGRQARAVLFPIGDVASHLGSSAHRTATRMGLPEQMASRLEKSALETCEEVGFAHGKGPRE